MLRFRSCENSRVVSSNNLIEREVTGFHARVVQHECDHLDGVLYPMRMPDMRRFGYTEILFPDAEGEED